MKHVVIKYLLWTIFILINGINCIHAQGDFYDLDSIQDIRITFEQENWDEILDELYVAGNKERLLGSISINGENFDSVGVRYKGFSSVSTSRIKNPFNIKLDYVIKQDYQGIDKIKLGNVIHDPTFVREALTYEIARNYMPASLANFSNVYVNGEWLGVYSNVEAVNKAFVGKHFGYSEGPFFKGNPQNLSFTGENANLSDSPGTDTLAYEPYYDIESDSGWGALVDFIDVLNNDLQDIETVLNVDRSLWMHALNYTLVNIDSYIGYSQNYYLYQDEDLRFNPILWDLNMSFGSFRLTDASDFFDGFTIDEAKNLDPLAHLNSFSVQPRPLMRNLFENETYRKMYLAHIRTIVNEHIVNGLYMDRALEIQSVIQDDVQADNNKFYTNDAFTSNLDETYQDLISYPGLSDLMEGRSTYLLNYPGINGAPSIFLKDSIETAEKAQILEIKAATTDAKKVIMAYRKKGDIRFTQVDMIEQGTDSWQVKVEMPSSNLEYYFFAENDDAGIFSPENAAYKFHEVVLIQPITNAFNDIVINEFMATQDKTQADASGKFDDWIELYNTTTEDINLSGLYLSDKIGQPDKWALPDTIMPSNEYLIVWADEDGSEGPMHANFKLSSGGETLSLAYADGTVMDTITFDEQEKDITMGRLPNGTGPFVSLVPTFMAPNNTSDVTDLNNEESVRLKISPNPSEDNLYLSFNKAFDGDLLIFNMQGEQFYKQAFSGVSLNLNISLWPKGMYTLMVVNKDKQIFNKFVKL